MNLGGLSLSSLPVQFSSPLGASAWAVLLGVPVGIIALYFLKLRRHPVRVPSTLLWRRSLEDLHVNSLFQRLRRNLLLFLQLLAVLLAMLALAGPKVKGSGGQGRRYILAIDNSASMSATDVTPSRLASAKARALEVVDAMGGDDLAMVITFADRARVVASYTGDRGALRRQIDRIRPTEASTSLRDALQVAAGLANPQKQIGEGVVATDVVTPQLKIYTDGGFADVEGFSLGNLEPEVIVIGPPPPPITEVVDPGQPAPKVDMASDNVAILALQARRDERSDDTYEIFGRVHNYRAEPVTTEAKLLRLDPTRPGAEGRLIDAIALSIPAREEQSFRFELPDPGAAELEVRLDVADALPADDRAYAVVGNPRKAQVLIVTEGNPYLVDSVLTPLAGELAEVVVAKPDEAKADPIDGEVRAGRFDLIVYDRTAPERSPEANTLYFGALPPGEAYANPSVLENPVVLDWDVAHPLLQYIRDLPTIAILKAVGVEPPIGSAILIESNLGPLAFVAPREGYSDAVVTFALLDEAGGFNTNWYNRYSYPLFLFNALQVLGNARPSAGDEIHQPGQPVVLRADPSTRSIRVETPSGESETVERSPRGIFVASRSDATGIYRARWGDDTTRSFAINLFDARESDLAPRGLVPEGVPEARADDYRIKIGYNPVQGTSRTVPDRQDWWKPIAAIALAILLLEWYIYNRRVYI